MATSNSSEDLCKVLVKGIPENVSLDEIKTYFKKKRNGGGNYVSIIFPKSSLEKDTAVIELPSSADASLILSKKHQIAKKAVAVEKVVTTKVFQPLNVDLDEVLLDNLQKRFSDLQTIFKEIAGCCGKLVICSSSYGSFSLRGTWDEIHAAHDLLVDKLNEPSQAVAPVPSPRKLIQKNGVVTNHQMNGTSAELSGGAGLKSVEESVVMDVDFYAFIKLQYDKKFLDIWSDYHVEVREIKTGKMMKVTIRPTTHPATDVPGAVYSMNKLTNELMSSLCREIYTLALPDDNKVDFIINQVMGSCPGVYLSIDSTDSLKVNILTSSRNICDLTKKKLEDCCEQLNGGTSVRPKAKMQPSTSSPTKPRNVPIKISAAPVRVTSKPQAPVSTKLVVTPQLPNNAFAIPKTNLVVNIIQGDISAQSCDIIVNTANSRLTSNQGVSGAIMKKGGKGLKTACANIMSSRRRLGVGEMVETIGQFGSLKCKSIIHVLGPVWHLGFSSLDIENKLYNILLDILIHASTSIALPAICTGAHGCPLSVFGQQFIKALTDFANQGSQTSTLREVTLVLYMKPEADKMVNLFKAEYKKSSLQTSISSMAISTSSFQPSAINLPSQQNAMLFSFPSPSKSNGSTTSKQSFKTCPICLEDIDPQGPIKIKMLACGCSNSTFHTPCIDQALQVVNKCPSCNFILGAMTGSQPQNGKMTSQVENHPLPGYENYSRIRIHYHFSPGVQGQEHPNPGHGYSGTSRTAFLPNNQEGQYVLSLLKRAFDSRLIFTVGQSSTTGIDNSIVWADIHHKTSPSGGAQRYGYPDPTYLTRVKDELKSKGIV